jgi:hypothetical protein
VGRIVTLGLWSSGTLSRTANCMYKYLLVKGSKEAFLITLLYLRVLPLKYVNSNMWQVEI